MWHLTKLALSNRLVTLGIVVVLAGLSIWAIFGLKMELIPDIEFPYATVFTVYQGATPDEVVSQVSSPIENVIWERWEGKGLKHVSSTSASNISVIFAEFEFGTSMDEVTETIQQGISGLTLPDGVLPQVVPINLTTMMPLVTFSLSGDIPPDQLQEVADSQIVPALRDIKGVLSVETLGGEKEQVIIAPDPEKMNQYGISVSQIISYLQLQPEYASLAGIENTPLGTDNVVLGQIAEVAQGPAPMAVVTRTDGQPSLTINVVKDDTSNTVTVANAVVAEADKIGKDLGSGLKLTVVSDQSDFIESSVSSLVEKALVGGALAIVVVFLFLMAVRASLVTAISIPLSMLLGFLAMRLSGITINILTLSAMSIAVGRLIDDSIVMVEVIYRRLQQGEGFREAAIGGAKGGGDADHSSYSGNSGYLPATHVCGRHRRPDVYTVCLDGNLRHARLAAGGVDGGADPVQLPGEREGQAQDPGAPVRKGIHPHFEVGTRTPCSRLNHCCSALRRQSGPYADHRYLIHVRHEREDADCGYTDATGYRYQSYQRGSGSGGGTVERQQRNQELLYYCWYFLLSDGRHKCCFGRR